MVHASHEMPKVAGSVDLFWCIIFRGRNHERITYVIKRHFRFRIRKDEGLTKCRTKNTGNLNSGSVLWDGIVASVQGFEMHPAISVPDQVIQGLSHMLICPSLVD